MRIWTWMPALGLALLLQGCLVAADVATIAVERPSQGVLNRMSRMCQADAGVRTFGPTPSGLDLWIPGRLPREPQPGDDLAGVQPMEAWWNSDEPWLRHGVARALYVNIAPSTTPPAIYQGPKTGDPAGIYRFELAPAADPRCVAYRQVQADWLKGLPANLLAKAQADPRCVVWSYLGPFDGRPRPDMFIRFDDEALRPAGIWREGEVFFTGGQVRARAVAYQAGKPGAIGEAVGTWQTSACEHPARRLPDGLFPPAPPAG